MTTLCWLKPGYCQMNFAILASLEGGDIVADLITAPSVPPSIPVLAFYSHKL